MTRQAALSRLASRFRRNCEGVAAVEFAITAPLFGLLIVGIATIALDVKQRSTAREAIRAGAHAVMYGEEDPAIVKQVVLYSLGSKRETASVDVTRSARCNGAETTAQECDGGAARQEFITINLNAVEDTVLRRGSAIQESIEVRIK